MEKMCFITEGLQAEEEEMKVLIADAERTLKKLTLAFGENMAAQVFSKVVGEIRWKAFCLTHGVKKINYSSYLEKHRKLKPVVTKIPPASDHWTLFGKEGVPILSVSQPYRLKHDDLLQIMHFCEANNLQVEIDASHSWWSAGMTLAVIFKPKEEAVTQEENHGKD
jgi:hypothetical protein